MSDLARLLESVRTRAAGLSLRSSIEDEAYPFMMDVFDLGLAIEVDPSRRAEVLAALAETVPHLAQEFGIFERFASHLTYSSWTGWTDELAQWEDLCTRRSALAFFAELYEDTALAPTLPFIDQTGLDRLMRDLSCHAFLEPGAIPAHMPTRHWWWWLPDAPPA